MSGGEGRQRRQREEAPLKGDTLPLPCPDYSPTCPRISLPLSARAQPPSLISLHSQPGTAFLNQIYIFIDFLSLFQSGPFLLFPPFALKWVYPGNHSPFIHSFIQPTNKFYMAAPSSYADLSGDTAMCQIQETPSISRRADKQ